MRRSEGRRGPEPSAARRPAAPSGGASRSNHERCAAARDDAARSRVQRGDLPRRAEARRGATMSDLSGRLRRLLFLVPYVARRQAGVRIDQLARELAIDREELLADLDLLTQVGPPTGDPGEYLLVSVEAGKVYVDLAQRLTRPLRLTPAEGCSLLLGLRALRRSGIAPYDQALASAERKLLGALGADAGAAERLAGRTAA